MIGASLCGGCLQRAVGLVDCRNCPVARFAGLPIRLSSSAAQMRAAVPTHEKLRITPAQ